MDLNERGNTKRRNKGFDFDYFLNGAFGFFFVKTEFSAAATAGQRRANHGWIWKAEIDIFWGMVLNFDCNERTIENGFFRCLHRTGQNLNNRKCLWKNRSPSWVKVLLVTWTTVDTFAKVKVYAGKWLKGVFFYNFFGFLVTPKKVSIRVISIVYPTVSDTGTG